MRLNEDEPLVWRDERSKVKKREVRRRGGEDIGSGGD